MGSEDKTREMSGPSASVSSNISIISDPSHLRYSLSSSGPSFRPHHSDIIFRNMMAIVYGPSSLPTESPITKTHIMDLDSFTRLDLDYFLHNRQEKQLSLKNSPKNLENVTDLIFNIDL